jgi:hypothetical protein
MSKLAEFTKDNLGGATVSFFKSNASFTRDGGIEGAELWFQEKPLGVLQLFQKMAAPSSRGSIVRCSYTSF